MIVRNGAATLPDCLRSVAPLCDELVVIDTGSTDDSPSIAHAFGARVFERPWQEDFSAARNMYLDKARCPWVLSLDVDEVLGPLDKDHLQAELASHKSAAYLFNIRNYFYKDDFPEPTLPSKLEDDVLPGISCIISRTVRLFPRLSGIRYCYPIHESLLPALRRQGIRLRRCLIPIHHFGYLNALEQRSSKAAAYRELGLKKIAQFPNYSLGYFELGKIYLHEGRLEEAQEMFEKSSRLRPTAQAQCYISLTLERQGRYDDCRKQLLRTMSQYPRNRDAAYLLERLRHRNLRDRTQDPAARGSKTSGPLTIVQSRAEN